jgi:carboxyl-terminal processing protease
MVFKGRTVLAYVLLAVLTGSMLTYGAANYGWIPMGENVKRAAIAPAAASGMTDKDMTKVSTAYGLIESRFLNKVDHDKIINGAITGMLGSLDDPFTSYMDQEEAKQFNDSAINSSFQGIGAEVSLDDGKVTVVAPIKGSPAEKAGLQSGDVITAVNGEKLDGLTLNQAVMKIRGGKGTEAKLGILRAGTSDAVELVLVRDEIPLETVYAEMLDGNIGKIEIRQFSANTAERFKEELTKLEANGMKGLVIDVRNDPGGLLNIVMDIAEHFVPKGKAVVQIENRDGKKEANVSKGDDKTRNYPVSVLINNGSASASEILAGALKESYGAKLVGEKSYGKGTVQITFEKEMGDGSNIKMTVFKWLTPAGNWIHKKGIEPDIKISQPDYFKVVPFSKKTELKPDMTHDEVKTLQAMLAGLGFKPDRTDGYYSEKTSEEVKAFQRQQKLPVTGITDVATMNKLEKETIAHIRDPKNDQQLKAAVQSVADALKAN